MKQREIYSCDQMMELIQEVGFLPLLDSGIRGYSAEGEVAHHGQHEQTAQVAAEVVRVVIALGHEEYHHRGRQPSDAVQEYLRRCLCLLVGLDAHPCQVVDRHGDDAMTFSALPLNSFNLICLYLFFRLFVCRTLADAGTEERHGRCMWRN